MPYTEEQFLEDYKRDVFRYDMLPHMTPEERMEGLRPQERLEGLRPQERLEGLKLDEVLANFKPEEIKKYLHSLNQRGVN